MSTQRRPVSVAVAAALLLAGLVASPAGPAKAAPKAKATWSACFRAYGPFQCATVGVPLDYDQPNGAQDLDRDGPAAGGEPGAAASARSSSTRAAPAAPGSTSRSAPARSSSPRTSATASTSSGSTRAASSAATRSRCFGTPRQWEPVLHAVRVPDDRRRGASMWIAGDRYLDAACDRRGGAILDHMSTANVARDMDRLRAGGRRREADLLRRVLRLDARPDLRQHVPRQLPGPRHRRRARPDRLDDRARPASRTCRSRPGCAATSARRTRWRSSSGSATRAATPARWPVAPAPRRATPPWPTRCGPARSRSRTRRPVRPSSTTTRSSIGDTLGAMYDSFAWPDFATVPRLPRVAGEPGHARPRACRRPRDLVRSPGRRRSCRGPPRGYVDQARLPAATRTSSRASPAVACADSDNPDAYHAWVEAGAAADAATRLLRPDLDLGLVDLRRVAGRRRRPLHGPVRHRDRRTRCSSSAPSGTRRRATRARVIAARPAAELGAADGELLGPHLAVHVRLRRRGDRRLPDLAGDARARDGMRPGPGAVGRLRAGRPVRAPAAYGTGSLRHRLSHRLRNRSTVPDLFDKLYERRPNGSGTTDHLDSDLLEAMSSRGGRHHPPCRLIPCR